MRVPFRLRIEGDEADSHRLPAYDGYMGLAGFSLALSLITNYAETGIVRHRGDFLGRTSVEAHPVQSGSIVADFIVKLNQSPFTAAAGAVSLGVVSNFLYDLFKRTVSRNVGHPIDPKTDLLKTLEERRDGDLEALVSAVEPSIRQAHMIVGKGAQVINIIGGSNTLNVFDKATKSFVGETLMEKNITEKQLSVASFNANSGHGSVFDTEIKRTIPIQLSKQTLQGAKSVLSWGLHEYSKGTGKKINLRFHRMLSLDGTPKRYLVVEAQIPKED